MRVGVHHLFQQALVGPQVEADEVLVHAFDLESERRGEVLLVPEQHVDVLDETTVHLGRALPAADRLPQRGPEVEVVRDHCPVPVGRLHRLERNLRRRLRERGEDPAAVEPADALASEDPLPVDIAPPQLRHRRVPTIGAAHGTTHPEAPLGEVETVAYLPPDAVVGHPGQMCPLDAALIDQILDQAADGVVGERRHQCRPQPEAPLQAAGHVVLAASLPHRKRPRRRDPPLPRVESQHHLAQRDEIPAALTCRPDGKTAHAAVPVASRASRVISSNRPSRTSSDRTSQLPPHATTAGTAR